MKYEEPWVLKQDGIMYGLNGSCTYRKDIVVRGECGFSHGQMDYENSGTMDNVNNYILELRGLLGNDFTVSNVTTFTPYIGFGYRYLNDDSSGYLNRCQRLRKREQLLVFSDRNRSRDYIRK